MRQNAKIDIYRTRPDKDGKQGWQARIRISEPAEPCVIPKQKTLYTAKWANRMDVWADVEGKLTLENIR